jgi:uncharacterized protein YyaL (SSP411 family)
MTVTDWIRRHLERELGISDPISIDQINRHVSARRCPTFEQLRNDRIAIGFLRYESVRGRAPDYARRARVCLDLYERTGNREFLVDVANFVEFEWIDPSRAGAYFEAIDGHRDGHHDS